MRPLLLTLFKLSPRTQSNISLCFLFCFVCAIVLLLMLTIIIILNLFLQELSKLTGRGGLCPSCRYWTESLRDETFHQFWMPLRLYFMAYLTSCNTCNYSWAFTDFVPLCDPCFCCLNFKMLSRQPRNMENIMSVKNQMLGKNEFSCFT